MLRFLTAGESHGKGVVVILEGMPANVPISIPKLQEEMQKRKKGAGSGGRQLIEDDKIDIISGIRFGKTLGSPIAILVPNKDFPNWGDKMSTEEQDEDFVEKLKVQKPRPGHADLAGAQKYNFDDVRNVLERASARETTARVAAGAICKQLLEHFGIRIASHTIQIGTMRLPLTSSFLETDNPEANGYSFEDVQGSYTKHPETRCIDTATSEKMVELVNQTRKDMNTLGGCIEIWAVGVPVGLGSHVHYDQKLDGQLAQALMSVPSVKAVEIGEGVQSARAFGTEVHDEIVYKNGYSRTSNRAGGIEGGITNGMPVITRVYHKPISTIYKPLKTVNIKTKEPSVATVERSDICVVPRAGVVSESMVAFVLARAMLEKFGGDEFGDIQLALKNYRSRLYQS